MNICVDVERQLLSIYMWYVPNTSIDIDIAIEIYSPSSFGIFHFHAVLVDVCQLKFVRRIAAWRAVFLKLWKTTQCFKQSLKIFLYFESIPPMIKCIEVISTVNFIETFTDFWNVNISTFTHSIELAVSEKWNDIKNHRHSRYPTSRYLFISLWIDNIDIEWPWFLE